MALKEMKKQYVTHEDGLYDLNDAKEAFRQSVATRLQTITVLREQAAIAEKIHEGCSLSNRNASFTGACGGAFGILAGGITVASGGLAAPFVIGGLTCIGAACSVGGGAWSAKNEYDRSLRNSDIQQTLLQQFSKDEQARRQMNNIFEGIKKGYFGEPEKIFRELHTVLAGTVGIGMVFGSTAAIKALPATITSLASYISPKSTTILSGAVQLLNSLTEQAALEGMEEAVKESASLAVKHIRSGFSKDFVRREALKAANKEYKEVLEKCLEKAAKETAKKASKKVASSAAQKSTQEAAKKTAEEAAKKAAEEAAKKAAEQAAKKTARKAAENAAGKAVQEATKTAAKRVGMLNMGFGAFSCVWEGCNAYKNHYASQEESELGKELRCLANNLEGCLQL